MLALTITTGSASIALVNGHHGTEFADDGALLDFAQALGLGNIPASFHRIDPSADLLAPFPTELLNTPFDESVVQILIPVLNLVVILV